MDGTPEVIRNIEADRAAKENLYNAQTSFVNLLIDEGVVATEEEVGPWLVASGKKLSKRLIDEGLMT